MGLLYKVEYYTSNDVLLCSGHIGLAVTPNPGTSVNEVQDNYNYFTDELSGQTEFTYLGSPYFASSDVSDYNLIDAAGRWLPACRYQGVDDAAFDNNGLTDVKIKFVDNDYYITQTGGRLKGYDNNDNEIFNYTLPTATEPVWGSCIRDKGGSNQRLVVNTLTVREINSDGTIPTTATCWATGIAIYKQNLLGIAKVTGQFKSWGAIGDIATFFNATPHYQLDDPYEQDPAGSTGTGGGTGTFDGTGDDVDIPGLPTLSAVDSGFITLFNPSIGELKSLANYMWSSGFDLDTFKKLFADPMDCILGLSIVPVAVPNGGSRSVSVGNISTGVNMTVAARQYVEVDCGTLNVQEYWGAYLDYDPYTKAEIYLPYIGTHPIATDDIMGKSVHVVYHVDILSGACTAFVKCGGSVLYEFIGQCSSSIPITGNDWTNVINGVLAVAGAIGTMVATGGSAAPMAAGMIASTAVNGMKPNVEKSGSMSGTGGMLAVQTPYLILTRPRQAVPSRQNSFMGYPSFITENMGSLSGYTEIEYVHLEGISATQEEIKEIEMLLKTGVIF